MKIAVVADGLGFGGTEKSVINFSNLLYHIGHQVEVINLDPKKNELIGLLSPEIRILKFRLSNYSSPYLYYFGIKKWKWALYIVPFVLIVLRILLMVIKLFRVRRTKYDVAIALSGHFNDLTFVAEEFVKANRKVAWIHGSLSGYLHVSDGYSFLYKQFNKVVTISMYNHEIVMFANKWLKNVEFVKLYNPVNFSVLKIDPFIIKDLKERFGDYLLMVGRMDQTKDQLTLIRAIKHYVEVHGSSPKLVLVGDGITRVDLELFVNENNLSNYVCFEGSQIDVHNYYSAASIFLHSSPLEGLPTTLIEAMYYGLPIIASDSIPGVREILGNNEYGVIVGLNDYIGFSDSIQELLFNKNIYNHFKSKSLLRVKDFSFEEIGSQLAKVLS